MLRASTAARSSSDMLTSEPSPLLAPLPPPAAASLAAVSSLSFAASASISATLAFIAASSAASVSSSPAMGPSDEGAAPAGLGAGCWAGCCGADIDEGTRESGSSIERRRPDEASVDILDSATSSSSRSSKRVHEMARRKRDVSLLRNNTTASDGPHPAKVR